MLGFQAMETQMKLSEAARSSVTNLSESSFIKACRREQTSVTPVWLMRQAGRFMPEYREIRAKVGFLELCKTPALATEVTVMAQEMLGVDAAIIFADILLPLEPMGMALEFTKGDGPQIHNPIRQASDVDALKNVDAKESLSFVLEAITMTRGALKANIPLIGFAGAPFTLASYMIEGGSSRNFEKTKAFMYTQPQAWHKLMNHLANVTHAYLNCQIEAGAQVVQLFDSWVGALGQSDYKEYVLPHMKAVFAGIKPGVPAIHFGTGTAALLKLMRQAGGTVIGVDWRIDLDKAWSDIGYDIAVQGNLDPCVLFATGKEIRTRVQDILKQAAGREGFIFNLGHGILPGTPVDNVKYLVECVHELGQR
jgi:uroporphyrinogen decarboxylase